MREGATGVAGLPLGESAANAETLLRTETFQQRMEEARRKRERVLSRPLAEKSVTTEMPAPAKPWDRPTLRRLTLDEPSSPALLNRVTKEPELFTLAAAAPARRVPVPAVIPPAPPEPVPMALAEVLPHGPVVEARAEIVPQAGRPVTGRIVFGFAAGLALGLCSAWVALQNQPPLTPPAPLAVGPSVVTTAAAEAPTAGPDPVVSAAASEPAVAGHAPGEDLAPILPLPDAANAVLPLPQAPARPTTEASLAAGDLLQALSPPPIPQAPVVLAAVSHTSEIALADLPDGPVILADLAALGPGVSADSLPFADGPAKPPTIKAAAKPEPAPAPKKKKKAQTTSAQAPAPTASANEAAEAAALKQKLILMLKGSGSP